MMMDSEMPGESGFIQKAAKLAASLLPFILRCHSWMCTIRDLYTFCRSLFHTLSYIFNLMKSWWDHFPDFIPIICSNVTKAAGFIIRICTKGTYHVISVSYILQSLLRIGIIKLFLHFDFFFYRLYVQILSSLLVEVPLSYSKPRRFQAVPRVDKKMASSAITAEDITLVMANLGLVLEMKGPSEGTPLEITAHVFDEDEPSLEEVREAFDRFDQNGDGFIDAQELKKVINSIGLTGFSLHECQRMIMSFDDNGDGRIDLREFTKLMEACSCD